MKINFIIVFLSLIFSIYFIKILFHIIKYIIITSIRFLKKEYITDYFTANELKINEVTVYIINQKMNKKGKAEITKLRENMTDMRIRDRMKEVGQFFDKQLNILFKSLAEKNYSELQIKTHLGRKLEQAKEDGYIESVVIKRNDIFDIIIDFIYNIIGNIKRKCKGCGIERKGRPLIELKKLIGNENYKTALYCKHGVSKNPCCCKCCKRNNTCSLTAKSHCQKYTWKTFKTYRIKLNIDKILSSDFSE